MSLEQLNNNFDHDTFRALRDQKSADFNPEANVVYEADQKDFDKVIAYQQKTESMDSIGSAHEAEKRIINLIDSLNNITLREDYSADEFQKKLLKSKIEMMKKLIEQSLNYAVEYVDSIRRMSKIKLGQSETSREEYLDDIRISDAERRAKHNALIDSLKIANRFLQNNFGKISSERQQKFVDDERKVGRQIVEIERQDFGKNGLVSDKIDLNERDQVKDWAIAVVDTLEQIKKEL